MGVNKRTEKVLPLGEGKNVVGNVGVGAANIGINC
jgi:hypothetical protein